MSNLSEFLPFEASEIEQAKNTKRRFRSPFVCICGHSEGAHMSRRNGFVVDPAAGTREICSFGENKTECKCAEFKAVLESTDVRAFRYRAGQTASGHPLSQGLAMTARKTGVKIDKTDKWVCAANGCGSTGSLYPMYFEVAADGTVIRPVNMDTGHTFLLCAIHASGGSSGA